MTSTDLARIQSERDHNATQLAESQRLLTLREETIKLQQDLLYNAASNEGTIKGLADQMGKAFDAQEKAEGEANELRMANGTLQKENQDLKESVKNIEGEKASIQSRYDSATENSNIQIEALQKTSDQQKNTVNNLRVGVRRILRDRDQSVINLGPEDDVSDALHIAVMTDTELEERRVVQEESGDFQSLHLEVMATRFQTKVTPKSLATLLNYIAQSGNHHKLGEIDDLAHLQMDWLRHPRSTSEPLWVWFDIAVILQKSLRMAFEQRDALRMCMILSLGTQLDHILGPLKKLSFLQDQVEPDFFKEMILGLGLMGFIPFVIVARFLTAHDLLDWMDSQPGYEQLYGGRRRRKLRAWASEVPMDMSLVRVINSRGMQELALSLRTSQWEKTERSTGHKISFFRQVTTGVSSLENEPMMFLEIPAEVDPNADATASNAEPIVIFNPPFSIEVELTERHYQLRVRFKKGSEGFKAHLSNDDDNLLKWVKRFHFDRYKEAVIIANRADPNYYPSVPKVEGIDQ